MQRDDVQKNDAQELPIPRIWRDILLKIVDAVNSGNFAFREIDPNVQELDDKNAEFIRSYVQGFGVLQFSMPSKAWNSSIYRWMDGYWQLLIDLYSGQGDETDLVLFVRVNEADMNYRFSVQHIIVP